MDDLDKERLEREINILENTFHSNIIKIYQVKESETTICMIMEYAEGGELFNYIIDKGYLSEDESRYIFQQMIDGIYYLHRMGICHRDLKPENILFDTKEKKRIKIIDFGLSNLYIYSNHKKEFLETPCGSPGYAPPEMILGKKYEGILTDIWSCGIILFAMMFGYLPFDDYDEEKLYRKIINGKYEYPKDITVSEEAKNFINSILVVNPKYRANINDIKNNKWFKKNYKPSLGLYNSLCEIPISNLIVKEMMKMGFNKFKIIENIKNNRHNNLSTIYYLLVKQKLKKGIETESDLISNSFQEYIKKQYNKLINNYNNIIPMNLKEIIAIQKEKYNEIKNSKKMPDTFREKKKNNEMNWNRNNNKEIYIRKNKTISKEKIKNNKNYFNSEINNIKNIHYININNIKANILMKVFNTENNHKKSKNKMKNSQKITTKRYSNSKEGKDTFINLNYFKNKKTLSRSKKTKFEQKNNLKSNRTMCEDSNKNMSINNININHQILSYKNKNGLINKNLRNKLHLTKLPTYGNFISKIKINNNTKKQQLVKDKENNISFLLKYKMKKLKIDSSNQLLNNLKSSKIRQNKFIVISDSNFKSISSSNSRTKSNSIREKRQQNGFLFLNSSRNYNKKNSRKTNIENKICNLTQQKIYELNTNMKNKNNKIEKKEQSKKLDSKINLKIKKDSSNPKNISFNNKSLYLTDKYHRNKIKQINYGNIFMVKKNNNIYRNNTANLDNQKINQSNSYMNLSTKNDKSSSLAFIIKNKEKNKKTELNSNKNINENLLKKNLNTLIRKKIKHKINLRTKLKEYNKMNILDTISNTINTVDNYSRDINDMSNNNLIKSNKTKISEINNNILKSNKSNNKMKKKIKIGNFRPLKFKNIMLLRDFKQSNTFRKTPKFLADD